VGSARLPKLIVLVRFPSPGAGEKLELEWSPEQIAAWLCRSQPDSPGWHGCHGIYQSVSSSFLGPDGACEGSTWIPPALRRFQ